MMQVGLISFSLITAYVCANEIFLLGQSNEQFAAKIYQILGKSPKNFLMSPYSVQTIMALTQTGARGLTLEQMSSVLLLPKNNTILEREFFALHESFRDSKDITLNIANKVYVREDFKLSDEFRKSANAFESEFGQFNVIEPEKVAYEMNEWIGGKTYKRINDIVKADYIQADTAMILINAVYFKGGWAIPFVPIYTQKADFYCAENQPIKVDMMHTSERFNFSYNKEYKVRFLHMDYIDRNFEFIIILPDEIDGYKYFPTNIYKLLQQEQELYEKKMDVYLPRFSMHYEIQFREVFEQLGMISPFSNADFSGLTESSKPLEIKKIVQKTFMEVNEEGSEAYAATINILSDRISSPDRFVADHPFLFTVRHKPTRTILFLGHYTGIPNEY